MEETLTLIHVLAAIVWVGGGTLALLWGERAVRADDDQQVATWIRNWTWAGFRFFMPAALVLIASGVWLVIESEAWDFDQTFVTIGFVGFALSFVIGAAYYGPEGRKIETALDAHGAGSAEVRQRLARVRLVSWVELVVLLVVVWAMVTKPGL